MGADFLWGGVLVTGRDSPLTSQGHAITKGHRVLSQTHSVHVPQADRQAFECLHGSAVPFDEIPPGRCATAGVENCGPVQVAGPYFRHELRRFCRDVHVFDVDAGDAIGARGGDPVNPGRRVTTAVGNPIGVHFEPDQWR